MFDVPGKLMKIDCHPFPTIMVAVKDEDAKIWCFAYINANFN
jgi:hypothetical protein